MLARDNQGVSRPDRTNVRNGHDEPVLINDLGAKLTHGNPAEDAVAHWVISLVVLEFRGQYT
jgi:hypothetical protein